MIRLAGACLQGAGVEQQLHRARDVRRRAPVGAAQEPVALETADVATDRHLRNPEFRRQLGDVNRLVLGDLLEDAVATIDGVHGAIFSNPSHERTS